MTSSLPPLELESFLPYRLNVLAETVSQSLAGVYRRRYGITVPEWRLIATLGQFGTVTAKGIGHHSRMHKTKVSRAAATLEARALIRREPNSQDMRESFLALTEDGRAIYETLAPQARDFAQALVAGFSSSERAALDGLLERLMLRAQELTNEMAE
ncbi:MarR family winged helix-turn-helix transcriptional regulator [Stappia stellulata]|uniref:MarR family winged helix-turn-helix transcriptional regulator n=1 Tax=Stappia stellulata TaxID=71235 RepID=UPI000417AC87|nr:MarR family transcriptional regulator [Stappia stellulata]